jgi:hypothetical protein
MSREDSTFKGVRDSFDFWLSQHEISFPALLEQAIGKVFREWLDENRNDVLERVAKAGEGAGDEDEFGIMTIIPAGMVHLEVDLPTEAAWALAQFLERCTRDVYRQFAADDDEAHQIEMAVSELQAQLREERIDPGRLIARTGTARPSS